MTQTQERRRHPRLPLHLSVAKLVDFKCEGLEQTSPAVLIDLSAGGLAMICFALPAISQRVSLQLKLPGLVNAQLNGRIVHAHRKGETYRVSVEFTEFQKEWEHFIAKLVKSYNECEERWNQGDRKHCPKSCSYHKAFPRDDS
jgi:c-di-GMP-binding flagellar brake protein YcgR